MPEEPAVVVVELPQPGDILTLTPVGVVRGSLGYGQYELRAVGSDPELPPIALISALDLDGSIDEDLAIDEATNQADIAGFVVTDYRVGAPGYVLTGARHLGTAPPPDDGYTLTPEWDEAITAHHQRTDGAFGDAPTDHPVDVDADVAVVHTLLSSFPREEVRGKVRRHLTRYTDRQRTELLATALVALADEQGSHAITAGAFGDYVEMAGGKVEAFSGMFGTLHSEVTGVLASAFDADGSAWSGQSVIADLHHLVDQRNEARAEVERLSARLDRLVRERDAFCDMFNTLHLGVGSVLDDAFEAEDSVRHGRSAVADVRLLVAQRNETRAERDAARAEVARLRTE